MGRAKRNSSCSAAVKSDGFRCALPILRACESFFANLCGEPCDPRGRPHSGMISRFCEIAQNELRSSELHGLCDAASRLRLTAPPVFALKRAACWSKGRHHEGAPDSAKRARSPRAERHTPLPGGFGAPLVRHYDRSARSSLHWRRGGSSRLHPAVPGNAARG
jgi:hypothetical protein